MVSWRKTFTLFILLTAVTLLLAGCGLFGSDDDGAAATAAAATADPNAGGGTSGPAQTQEGGAAQAPTAVPIATQPAPTPEAAPVETVVEPTAVPVVPAATAVPPTASANQPGTQPTTEVVHIVQPGENLFRIGLQYGYSWTVLAQYNGIPNPNFIYAGQSIRIPAAGSGGGTGGVPPEGNYTYYVVQPGENLYQIGLKFGMSWVLIAEANGITNPNFIVAGQVLKIPI